ncbi:hypothetical protein WJX73_001835 [Symbiochloris irregularis]|uniref:Protein kinase domain-containing protein n=1 Tax=Symbiochloris irregularis TaxID=706552 RepID=A0AAW1PYJ4_9CHLO
MEPSAQNLAITNELDLLSSLGPHTNIIEVKGRAIAFRGTRQTPHTFGILLEEMATTVQAVLDIKSDNLLLSGPLPQTACDPMARLVLGDWGIAISLLQDIVQGPSKGYAGWGAPETAHGAHSRADDLWCIGALLYQLCTGRAVDVPSDSEQLTLDFNRMDHRARLRPALSELHALNIEPYFATCINNLMDVDQGKRWTVADLASFLGTAPAALWVPMTDQQRLSISLPARQIPAIAPPAECELLTLPQATLPAIDEHSEYNFNLAGGDSGRTWTFPAWRQPHDSKTAEVSGGAPPTQPPQAPLYHSAAQLQASGTAPPVLREGVGLPLFRLLFACRALGS